MICIFAGKSQSFPHVPTLLHVMSASLTAKNIKLLKQPVTDSHSEIIWINWLCEITAVCSDTNAWSSVPKPHRTHHSWPVVLTRLFFFQTASKPHTMSLTGGERWNKSRRGACPAEVQAWGVNRCVGSLPFRNGSRTRCTAAGCGTNLPPPP